MNGIPLQSILELISQIKVLLDESYRITCRGYDPSKIVGRHRPLLTIRPSVRCEIHCSPSGVLTEIVSPALAEKGQQSQF